MKKYLFLIIAIISYSATSIQAQENKLNYSLGKFYVDDGEKTHWKSADHLFEHDQELLNKYVRFRTAKKSANTLGVACLAQAVTGAGLIFIPGGSNCEYICDHQAVGIILLLITAPVTGLVGIVVAGVASGRKSKLIYEYDQQDLSFQRSINQEQPQIIIGTNGLGIGIAYKF